MDLMPICVTIPTALVFDVTTPTVGIIEPDESTAVVSLDLSAAKPGSIYEVRALFSAIDASKYVWLGVSGSFVNIGGRSGSGDWLAEGCIVVNSGGSLRGYGASPANGAVTDLGTLSAGTIKLLAAGATVPWAYIRQAA